MLPKHTGKDTYTFFIYLIYKSYTVRLFLRKYFPKPEECACKALEKPKKIVQIICFFNLQLCTLYNSFVLPVQCYRVKCRMCTNTLANFVQSYYYTQRKKTKPTKKGEGADSIQAAPSFATDAILNQKDKDVLCIYVAIGQKASSIARVAEDLKKHGAMSYTTIVAATASDSAPLQYIAPYAGTALAEYFMAKGKSVLIVYDDLSKHAVAYRAISLLLRRSPGREAYPGDVFYLHSRLLERSCRMRDDLGGGSITALPIVETQAGDVSAYIPTNVISITDGQIFLESALFNAGNRPAVNVGLSVSRVGGAAQTKAMKKANANLRIELAQYKEMESFAQFSSDLDAETRRQLEHGKALMEMLKQPLCQPKSDAEQVVILVLASHGLLDTLPTAEQREKTAAFVRQFRADVSGTMQKIDADGKLEPDRVDAILNAWKAYAGGNDHVVQ